MGEFGRLALRADGCCRRGQEIVSSSHIFPGFRRFLLGYSHCISPLLFYFEILECTEREIMN